MVKCNHEGYKEKYNFWQTALYECCKCGVVFTDKLLKPFDPKNLYEKYYKNEIAARFNCGIEYVVRIFRFFRAFKIFTLSPSAKSILDIGSGRGFMLYYLKKYYGYQRAAGTQISKNALEFSRDKLGLEIYDKDLLELPLDGKFDIITMWHVLEHVTRPEEYIERIYSLLNEKGKLVVEVPNFDSWSRVLTGKYWLALDLDYHISFFTPGSLKMLLEKYKFKIKDIHAFSLEYSAFVSTQSFVSLATKTKHLFFQRLQASGFNKSVIPHVFLFILFGPACFFINLILYYSKKGEVLLIVAEKG